MHGGNLRCQKRLQKELEDMVKHEDTFKVDVDAKNFALWKVSFKGAESTIFGGEEFTLQFKFSNEYVKEIKFTENKKYFSQLIAQKLYLLGTYLRMNIFIQMAIFAFLFCTMV